jgi:glycosyltransferase involved in cell wall biosynthesis
MGDQLRKVLIISYYWPPSGGSAVQRWLKLVKYLREYGWEPVVYTPENPEYPSIDESLLDDVLPGQRLIRQPIWEPYSWYKKVVGLRKTDTINVGFLHEKKKNPLAENLSVWLRGNLFIPDARKFWIKPSIRFLTRLLQQEHFDAVISNGPPHSMHLIAHGVHRSLGIPWLADFCDPWTGIDFYDKLKLTSFADRKHHRLEKMVLRSADRVIVVTPDMAKEFKQIADRMYDVVTNGFDESDFNKKPEAVQSEKFSIAHIGSLVPARNPVILWEVLSEMCKEVNGFAEKLEIKLAGKVDHSVLQSIEEAGLGGFLRREKYLEHDRAILELHTSQVLLLLINRSVNAKGILTGKIFEYLAAGRQILCLGPTDGDAAGILAETGAGLISDYEDIQTLKTNILYYYNLFLEGKSALTGIGIDKYAWRSLAGEIANVLNELTRK